MTLSQSFIDLLFTDLLKVKILRIFLRRVSSFHFENLGNTKPQNPWNEIRKKSIINGYERLEFHSQLNKKAYIDFPTCLFSKYDEESLGSCR